jgi:hypothetical protein
LSAAATVSASLSSADLETNGIEPPKTTRGRRIGGATTTAAQQSTTCNCRQGVFEQRAAGQKHNTPMV